MIDAGSTTLNNKWKNVLHNQADDYIIPESDVNIMCRYDTKTTQGCTVTSSTQSSISNRSILAKDVNTIIRDRKVATFEWNFWVLDGTYEVLNDNTEKVDGFVSNQTSNENCVFNSYSPYVIFDYSWDCPLMKNQTLKFAPAMKEIPAEITIFASGSEEQTITFDIEQALENDNFNSQEYVYLFSNSINESIGNNRIIITFNKTMLPYRKARLTEYNNGFFFFLNKYDLLNFTHTRSASVLMDELPHNDLQFTICDENGIYDNQRITHPFFVNFGRTDKFYVYYGYNFDDIGWNYVQVDCLVMNNIDINRDSIETTFNLQSELQLYTNYYPPNSLNPVPSQNPPPYDWNTFNGFLNAICDYSGIPYCTIDSNRPPYIDSFFNHWQLDLYRTKAGELSDFGKTPANELMQQICSMLRCVLLRQPNGTFYVKYMYANQTVIDTVENAYVITFPNIVKEDENSVKYINFPKINPEQMDDEQVDDYPPTRLEFLTNGDIEMTQNAVPLGQVSDSDSWKITNQMWVDWANYWTLIKNCPKYEFGELFFNPLLQVTDYLDVSVGENYAHYGGIIEKIEVQYDGSFKGNITLVDYFMH